MGLRERIDFGIGRVIAVAVHLRSELVEEAEHAFAADPGTVDETHARRIGRGLLDPAEGEIFADRGALAHHQQAGARLARARRHRCGAEQQAEDRDVGVTAVVLEHGVAADDVADLVRDHALDFVGGVGRIDQPRMDIDDLPARDERVDRRVVDQHDANVVRRQPRRDDDRARHVGQQRLGLGIAQDRLRGGGLDPQQQSGREQGEDTLHGSPYLPISALDQWRWPCPRTDEPLVKCRPV